MFEKPPLDSETSITIGNTFHRRRRCSHRHDRATSAAAAAVVAAFPAAVAAAAQSLSFEHAGAAQVGCEHLRIENLLRINRRKILIEHNKIGVLAHLEASEVLLISCCIGAAEGVIANRARSRNLLVGMPSALRSAALWILACNGRIDHMHAVDNRDGRIRTKRLANTALLVGRKRPHDLGTVLAKVTLGTTGV